jgi:hypothetical protein
MNLLQDAIEKKKSTEYFRNLFHRTVVEYKEAKYLLEVAIQNERLEIVNFLIEKDVYVTPEMFKLAFRFKKIYLHLLKSKSTEIIFYCFKKKKINCFLLY